MGDTFQRLLALVREEQLRISEHGYDAMADDGISVRDVIEGIGSAKVIEDYPNYHKGPCVLTLQQTRTGEPIHVVWGIPMGQISPAVLVTAYRPDVVRWSNDFMRRIR